MFVSSPLTHSLSLISFSPTLLKEREKKKGLKEKEIKNETKEEMRENEKNEESREKENECGGKKKRKKSLENLKK